MLSTLVLSNENRLFAFVRKEAPTSLGGGGCHLTCYTIKNYNNGYERSFYMYSEEVKDKILHLLKYKTIKEIAEEFGISYSTLYRWQKTKNDSKLIKELMLEEKYEEALVIGKDYPNNEVIKGQVMSIYMKKRDYEKAIQIAREFPNNASIQSQLMTVYVKNKDYEAAIKIAEKFSSYAPIQSQLMTVYM